MDRLGDGRVDFDLHRAVGADFHFPLGNQFRRQLRPRPPERDRPHASPTVPARIPVVVAGEPPVAAAVEPIPGGGRIPALVGRGALDLVFHLGLGDRRAEVVLGRDLGFDLLAQHDRIGGGVDRHLEFRLLVFLDAERAAAQHLVGVHQCSHEALGLDDYAVDAQRGVGRHLPLAVEPAILVGLLRFRQDLLALGIMDFHQERPAGERRGLFRQIVLGIVDPELVLHRLVGAIDGPVGDRVDLGLVVGGVVALRIPDAGETQVGQAPPLPASGGVVAMISHW